MERNRKKRNYKKERGITLVALIITIIVMLILVAVTVRVVVESDIIGVAEKAAESKETGELKDQIAMKIGEWQLGKYVEETKDTPLTDYLSEIEGVTVDGTSKIATITKGNTVITVNEKGEMMNSGEVDTWDGTKEIPKIKEGNIYIYNAKQFKYLADSVNGELGEGEEALTITADTTVYLMANLDLGARAGEDEDWGTADDVVVAAWTPIGKANTDALKFKGIFEGNGHVISGVYVSVDGNFGGVFGNTTNTIQNLIVKDSYIKATGGATGGIVGAARAGEILNCHNINTNVIGETINIGGVVGQSRATMVANCSNSGNIQSNGNGTDGKGTVGGVIGDTSGSVQDCSNFGTITGKGHATGGIIGMLNIDAVLRSCSNYGIVSGSNWSTGGICGYMSDDSKVEKCKNIGNITGMKHVGGITGDARGTIEKCYNAGDITVENEYLGGIAGSIAIASNVTIQNTYNTGTLISKNTSAGYVGGIMGGMQGSGSTTININNNYSTYKGVAIGSIEAPSTVTVNASKNYYRVEQLPESHTKTYETPIEDEEMRSEQFVTDLNTGLQEVAWVKTSGYPALIGM